MAPSISRKTRLPVDPPAGIVKCLAVPAHAPPRQFAGVARILLAERPLDAPVVRQIELPPAAVVESALHIGDVAAEMARRPGGFHGGEIDKLRAGRGDPVLDLRVVERARRHVGRIAFGEMPAGIKRDPLARRVRRRHQRGRQTTQCQTRPDAADQQPGESASIHGMRKKLSGLARKNHTRVEDRARNVLKWLV